MNPPSPWPSRGLYLITPDDEDTPRLLARVSAALSVGPALLQYRNKSASPVLRREQAGALLALCRAARVPLVVNDDWRLALEIGAEGAHLGEHDGALADARDAAPGLVLGASCYDDLERARRAAAAGADYVAFGAFHPSGTKPNARRAHPGLLRDSAALGRPRVAIGGITPDNAPALVAAGADFIAVVGGVFGADDPAEAVRAYRRAFESPLHGTTPE